MAQSADKLLILGATGDLAQRMLLPSLCALHADRLLPPQLTIVGAARSEMSDEGFRSLAAAAAEKHLADDRYSPG
jgi:glucose-6-phosphate 1-dehydrogenase